MNLSGGMAWFRLWSLMTSANSSGHSGHRALVSSKGEGARACAIKEPSQLWLTALRAMASALAPAVGLRLRLLAVFVMADKSLRRARLRPFSPHQGLDELRSPVPLVGCPRRWCGSATGRALRALPERGGVGLGHLVAGAGVCASAS